MILKYFLHKATQMDQSPTSEPETKSESKTTWPVRPDRQRVNWFPAKQRLIGLVRAHEEGFVLPPAVVRKATWQE